MFKALRINMNGFEAVDVKGESIVEELHSMQQMVGGHVEHIPLKDDGVMLVDEEGMLKQYPRNELASLVSGKHIYGTALIVGQVGDLLTDVPSKFLALLEIGNI